MITKRLRAFWNGIVAIENKFPYSQNESLRSLNIRHQQYASIRVYESLPVNEKRKLSPNDINLVDGIKKAYMCSYILILLKNKKSGIQLG